MEVQEASEPLGGVFSLVVNGDGYNGQTDPLPHDANTDQVRKNNHKICRSMKHAWLMYIAIVKLIC